MKSLLLILLPVAVTARFCNAGWDSGGFCEEEKGLRTSCCSDWQSDFFYWEDKSNGVFASNGKGELRCGPPEAPLRGAIVCTPPANAPPPPPGTFPEKKVPPPSGT
ncbi:hypothetical protein Ptr902_08352 [Pyrenophora tritici-repentis]|uniref:Uncharacterized protein n=1 Tax=Pyrenophora tritici-repentis TaxID=45151 RepID=A0A5M9LEV3_9PLEO|nr:hypothetical protein PtrV1_05440 [Pyrenophora tritici-repentis]KAF7450185.1 hypothetical protein A1F99_048010 [Pyrenophora tritici-repentis]KAF7572757.1 hypothetical protein PtrM4_076620 [Pyrenophora tritici-repentis]KAI0570495.1 hypothetical protein Alg215_11017 [Pyrenophora tritici-repentis]KAI1671005.1 hypothetical protein L13192_04362 [Pyrenophora tritici-repentis]